MSPKAYVRLRTESADGISSLHINPLLVTPGALRTVSSPFVLP